MTLYIGSGIKATHWRTLTDGLQKKNSTDGLQMKNYVKSLRDDSDCDCKIIENNFNEGYGKIEVRCGNLKCKFELKTFSYMYEEVKGTFV